MPGASSTTGGVTRQLRAHPQCYQRRLATTWCFPLPPQSSSQPHPDPAGKVSQYLRRLTEAEIASPTPHIRGQFRDRRFYADALSPSRNLSDSPLETLQSLRRNFALHLRIAREAEPEKLPFLRSRHRTLSLIYLEPERLCDESRDALHHPLPRPLAPHVDIAIVGIANKAVSPPLQLPVEFVEHEIAEQWRKRAPLRGTFHARTD